MKHASAAALDALGPLLEVLRQHSALKERSRGVFYCRGRACLHFHEDLSGLYADLRLPNETDFTRLPVNDEDGRLALLARLDGLGA